MLTGPSSGTRSQTTAATAISGTKTTAQLKKLVSAFGSPTCPIVVCDGTGSQTFIGRCDDGSDENIFSPVVAHAAVLNIIGRMTAINPIRIQVALKGASDPATFKFSRTWLNPRLFLQLSSVQVALLNVTFLFSDDNTACRYLLVGFPVVRHLGIDTPTILERLGYTLNGTDFSTIIDRTSTTQAIRLGRLLISRHRGYYHGNQQDDPQRPRVDYYDDPCKVNPFPD